MKVAGIQLEVAWEDPPENFRRAAPLLRGAAEAGASLAVLPEMFATGFSMDVDRAAPAAGEACAFLARMARELHLAVVGGVAEKISGDPAGRGRNMALAFGADGGEIGRYQKIHPFGYGGEDRHYAGGDSACTFEVDGLRVTPFVCYDLRFPEIFRALAGATDLFLVIASWPVARIHAWRSLLVARAIENQCFVLGVNRTGAGGGLEYSGDSLLADPLGEILARAAPGQGLVVGNVSAEAVASVRERLPFLKDRRPEVYRKLGGNSRL